MSKNENIHKPSSQQGTGSAENIGESRSAQKNRMADTNPRERQVIAHEADVRNSNVSDIKNLGGLSGRDDYAGGDSDGMSNQSTNEPTER